MVKNIRDDGLDSQKNKSRIRKSYERFKPDIILYIRDLDDLETNKEKIKEKKKSLQKKIVLLIKKLFFCSIFMK